MNMLAPVTHILPITLIRRERRSPIKGRLLVRQGQSVHATDVLLEANLHPEHLLLNVARALGVDPQVADKNVAVREGEQVAEGDVIAGPVGLARRVLRSPRDGRVLLSGNGQILLDVTSSMVQLKAGIPGEVVELLPEKGAVIETTGTLIQGVWGNGKIGFGLMSNILKSPDHVITPDQLDVSLRGAVVLAGHCNDPEVIRTAEELPLRGLVLSSLSPDLLEAAEQSQMPILILDGFGARPFNLVTYKLLMTSERRDAAVNAEPWDRLKGIRPELVIPIPGSGALELPKEAEAFAASQQVRILCAPQAGKVGKIVGLKGVVPFPSGYRLPAAEIRLEAGEKLMVPLANLEVLA
jgi:hypothetical protein